jgi:pyruvate dehydrogenase E2 component (dihydrolipoamide acetyltransferase)
MPFTVTMPKLSPTMESGVLVKWHVKEGALVKVGDVLFEVATDKATVEHAALDGGYVRKILIQEGGEAIVNQPLAIFTEKKEESIEGYQPEGDMPKAPIAKPAVVAESAPVAKAPTGAAMQQPAFVPEPPLEQYTHLFPTEEIGGRLKVSPLARKLAQEKGVDLSTVKGSGPHGRIVSSDLPLGQPAASVAFGHRELPQIPPGTYEEEPLTPMRKTIGQRLQQSKSFIPHFYVTQEIKAAKLVDVQQQLKNEGIKISYNDFIIRAAALALKEYPAINSGFNSETNSIIRFKTIDISIAVSVPAGLITPIIRYADCKNLGQLSVEMKSLAARAREGKLKREEYMGGSFSISNLGMFGISDFVAVINPPQAAILAVGGIEDRPVVHEGVVIVGKTMHLTLSADHRVVDGAAAALFLKSVQKFLEAPALLLI